jgi:hypothetical protein
MKTTFNPQNPIPIKAAPEPKKRGRPKKQKENPYKGKLVRLYKIYSLYGDY